MNFHITRPFAPCLASFCDTFQTIFFCRCPHLLHFQKQEILEIRGKMIFSYDVFYFSFKTNAPSFVLFPVSFERRSVSLVVGLFSFDTSPVSLEKKLVAYKSGAVLKNSWRVSNEGCLVAFETWKRMDEFGIFPLELRGFSFEKMLGVFNVFLVLEEGWGFLLEGWRELGFDFG